MPSPLFRKIRDRDAVIQKSEPKTFIALRSYLSALCIILKIISKQMGTANYQACIIEHYISIFLCFKCFCFMTVHSQETFTWLARF